MTLHPSPERLRRFGIEDARSNRQPGQVINPSQKTLALLLGDVILEFATERAQRRAEGGAA